MVRALPALVIAGAILGGLAVGIWRVPPGQFCPSGVPIVLRRDVVTFPGPWGDSSAPPDRPRPFGMAAHSLYLMDEGRFAEARTVVDELLAAGHVKDGALFLAYPDDIDREIGALRAPWYSGAGNGVALVAVVRLYEAIGDERYLRAADGLYAAFLIEGTPYSIVHREDDQLWIDWGNFSDPNPVLNTHMFGIFGLYAYWEVTGRGEHLIEAAVRTVGERAHRFLPTLGPRSWYDLRHHWRADEHYHGIIAPQLDRLSRMSGASCLSQAAEAFRVAS